MDWLHMVKNSLTFSKLLRTKLVTFLFCLCLSLLLQVAILSRPALAQTAPASNPTTASTPQSGIGKISGKISNGTLLGTVSISTPQMVKLERVAVTGSDSVDSLQTNTDGNGNFLFQNLPLDNNFNYYVSTQYSGVTYYVQNEIKLSSSHPNQTVELKIYETTSDSTLVSIVGTTMVIPQVDAVSGQIFVLEMYSLQNKGNRTFIGQPSTSTQTQSTPAVQTTITSVEPTRRNTTLRFYLPPGATGLTPTAGIATEDIIVTTDGIEITTPIPPGDNQIVFNYRVGYSGETLSFSKKLAYDTPTFRLFTPVAGPKAVSSQLVTGQPVQMGQQQLSTLTGQKFKANTQLNIQLNNLPLPPDQNLFATRDIVLKIGLFLTLLAALTFLFIYSRRHSARKVQVELPNLVNVVVTPISSSDVKGDEKLEHHRKRLLYELAELDNGFANGEFGSDEKEYQRQRLFCQQTLMEIWSEVSQSSQSQEIAIVKATKQDLSGKQISER